MRKTISSPASQLPVPVGLIERRIYLIRGQKVMLDADLAELYQVPTKRLNEAVKRNRNRFPDDFMFRLTVEEAEILNRSQIATGSQKHRDPRLLPYAFTELGVAMLSSVLNSDRAVQMNILILRAFVKLRELLAAHKDLARKIEQLEARSLCQKSLRWKSGDRQRNSAAPLALRSRDYRRGISKPGPVFPTRPVLPRAARHRLNRARP